MNDPGRGGLRSLRGILGWLLVALVVLGVPALLTGSCTTQSACETPDPHRPPSERAKRWYGIGDAFGVCV